MQLSLLMNDAQFGDIPNLYRIIILPSKAKAWSKSKAASIESDGEEQPLWLQCLYMNNSPLCQYTD